MKLSNRNARDGYCLVLPLLIGCLIFGVLPLAIVMQNSMLWGIRKEWVGLANFVALLKNSVFQLAIGNTVKFLAFALPLVIVLAFAIALMLKDQFQALKSVLLLPYVMPVVGTVMLADALFSEYGIMNEVLRFFGLPITDWLQSDWAFWIVIGLYLWKSTGYAAILLLSGLLTIPKDHYDAAALDGASRWQQLRDITIPQMWYSIFFAVVFSLINAFSCFREILLIGGKHPNLRIYMLQHFINNSFEGLHIAKISAASVIFFVGVSMAFIFFYRFVLRKEAYRE